MGTRIITLRSKHRYLVAALTATATIALAATVQAGPSGWFRAGDPGVRQAQDQGLGQALGQRAETMDVSIKLQSIIADDTETAIVLSAVGRPDLGDTLFNLVRPRLRTKDGETLHAVRASGEQGGGRTWVVVFPPVPKIEQGFQLEVDGIELLNWSDYRAFGAGARPDSPTPARSDLSWTVPVPAGVAHRAGSQAVPMRVGSSLGKGTIVIDEVVQAPTGVIIRGEVRGFTPAEAEALVFENVRLSGVSSEASFISGRSGFGNSSSRFEFRFTRITGVATFGLSLSPRADTGGSASSANLSLVLP